MDKIVFITSFVTYAEATLAQGLLKSHGIKSMTQPNSTGGAMTGRGSGEGPRDLFVLQKDLGEVKKILGVKSVSN